MDAIFNGVLLPLVKVFENMGVWGILVWMLFESSCIPLPSEIILPFGGLLVAQGTITLLEANVAAAVGSIIGSLVAYSIGSFGGRPFILKFGKYFFISEKNFYAAEKAFQKHGMLAVCLGRMLPVIRTFISLPAGIAKINAPKFVLYSLVGMIPWNFALIYLGYLFGKDFETKIKPYFKGLEHFVIAAIIVGIAGIIVYKLAGKKQKQNKNT